MKWKMNTKKLMFSITKSLKSTTRERTLKIVWSSSLTEIRIYFLEKTKYLSEVLLKFIKITWSKMALLRSYLA